MHRVYQVGHRRVVVHVTLYESVHLAERVLELAGPKIRGIVVVTRTEA